MRKFAISVSVLVSAINHVDASLRHAVAKSNESSQLSHIFIGQDGVVYTGEPVVELALQTPQLVAPSTEFEGEMTPMAKKSRWPYLERIHPSPELALQAEELLGALDDEQKEQVNGDLSRTVGKSALEISEVIERLEKYLQDASDNEEWVKSLRAKKTRGLIRMNRELQSKMDEVETMNKRVRDELLCTKFFLEQQKSSTVYPPVSSRWPHLERNYPSLELARKAEELLSNLDDAEKDKLNLVMKNGLKKSDSEIQKFLETGRESLAKANLDLEEAKAVRELLRENPDAITGKQKKKMLSQISTLEEVGMRSRRLLLCSNFFFEQEQADRANHKSVLDE